MLCGFLKTTIAITMFISTYSGIAGADELRIGGTGGAHVLNQKLAMAFETQHAGNRVEVVFGLGSSGGILAVIEGALDIAVSGRKLKPPEREKGAMDIEFFRTNFIFVTSHADRQKLDAVQLVAIFNGTLLKWPDGANIMPILRPKGDSVSEILVANVRGMPAAMEKLRMRTDVPVAVTDQDNVELAEKVQNSLTGMSLVQFLSQRPRLRDIEFEGIAPSLDNLRNGRYPLKYDVYLIHNAKPLPAVRRFIAFLNTPEAIRIINENGGLVVTDEAASIQ